MKRELFFPFNVLLLFCLNLALNVLCSQGRPPHRNHSTLSTDPLISLTAFRKADWTQILILGKKACAQPLQWLRLLAHTQLCSPHGLTAWHPMKVPNLPSAKGTEHKQQGSPSPDTSCFCRKHWLKVWLGNNSPDAPQKNVGMQGIFFLLLKTLRPYHGFLSPQISICS